VRLPSGQSPPPIKNSLISNRVPLLIPNAGEINAFLMALIIF